MVSLAGQSPIVAGVMNASVLATKKYWLHYWAPSSKPEMPQTPAMPALVLIIVSFIKGGLSRKVGQTDGG